MILLEYQGSCRESVDTRAAVYTLLLCTFSYTLHYIYGRHLHSAHLQDYLQFNLQSRVCVYLRGGVMK